VIKYIFVDILNLFMQKGIYIEKGRFTQRRQHSARRPRQTTRRRRNVEAWRIFRENQATEERVMDSNAIERERGIKILAKKTAVPITALRSYR
jgi:hypothetical protein